MIGSRKLPSADQASLEVIEKFRSTPTALISDCLNRFPGVVGLHPFHKKGGMAGTALTVRTRHGDNLPIHQALDLIRPGDVLVVDGGGDESRALLGEILSTLAQKRGAVGVVIDGAVRDSAFLASNDLPVFARSAIHRGPYKTGPGEINVPVSIGGQVIEPGDIVVGDEDGVVSFPQSVAVELLAAVEALAQKEADIIARIKNGTYASGL